MPRAAQLVAALAVVGTAAAGKFDKYKTCEACIEAGWGWNTKKGKCGAFPNKSCGNAAATAPVPPYNGEPVGLTDANFDAFVKSSDIVVVEFYAPWCGHCKKLEPIYAAAARALHSSMKNVKFAKVDSTDEACAETKAKYEVTGFPMTFMFRSGEKQYKILEEVSDRNVERISHLVKFESSQPAPPPPGAPIFMKFDLEGSSKLMEHKIKSQIAFFYSSSKPESKQWIDALEKTATEYAGKIIALYVDIDDPKNTPVLGRFNVHAGIAPCLRVAQIYPPGSGGGMEIFMPDPKANPTYQDRKVKTSEAMSAFAGDHLAKGDPLKGGRITIPFLRSENRPRKSHPHVVDLVGNNYDTFIGKKNRAVFSFFYMPTCPHCAELEPKYEAVATELAKLNKKRPDGAEEVKFVRMNTVRNDVAHFQIFTGSYPTIYWIPANDKEGVILVNNEPNFTQDEEGIWTYLAKKIDWLAKLPEVQAKVKEPEDEDDDKEL